MNKTLEHIIENTQYVDAKLLKKVYLTDTKQIAVEFKSDDLTWRGEIQKIYLDKNGEATGYDVYLY